MSPRDGLCNAVSAVNSTVLCTECFVKGTGIILSVLITVIKRKTFVRPNFWFFRPWSVIRKYSSISSSIDAPYSRCCYGSWINCTRQLPLESLWYSRSQIFRSGAVFAHRSPVVTSFRGMQLGGSSECPPVSSCQQCLKEHCSHLRRREHASVTSRE